MAEVPPFIDGPGLKQHHGTVISRRDGTGKEATAAQCSQCDGLDFMLYWIEEMQAVHVQCSTCGITYCLNHTCTYTEKTP